uniref:O-fucosyltransferase family protein n=1 Tax=Zea mays TaxID=4577 RepID=A0A804LEC7_MAIZE
MARSRPRVWLVAGCAAVILWASVAQLVAVGRFLLLFGLVGDADPSPPPSALPPPRIYMSNGYLKISCNGGLNQMRSEICDMVAVARLLNLTMVVPELDKRSFWADQSNFGDIFDVRHFINSLRDKVHIIEQLPEKLGPRDSNIIILEMPPVSWSDEKYYLHQILPLFNKYSIIHFNKTDARIANNGNKLVHKLRAKGSFVALHLRYEMDMLAFSGCNHGLSPEEAEELKKMRYAYPWWRDKEIDSQAKRSQGLCPLTPEEASLVLKALGFQKDALMYIAAGEIYGGDRRLEPLRSAFPNLVRKEMLLDSEVLHQFQNHSSQMAALDFIVSTASDVFIPTFDGNMAKLVEGHRRLSSLLGASAFSMNALLCKPFREIIYRSF